MTSPNDNDTPLDHRPVTGRAETTAVESHGGGDGASSGKGRSGPGGNKSDNVKNESPYPTTSPTAGATPAKQFTVPVSASISPRDSPRSSRNTSPTRPMPRQELPNTSKGIKSRTNSHEMSPGRQSSSAAPHQTVPSAAAIQRALSSAAAPSLHQIAVPDPQSKLPKPQKTTVSVAAGSEATTPHWPVSPRLKSPTPSAGSRRNSLLNPSAQVQRKADPASAPVTPSIVVQRSTPGSSTPTSTTSVEPISTQSDEAFPTPPKTSKSTMLETVQENSSPIKNESQASAAERNVSGRTVTRSAEEDRPPPISEDSTEESGDRTSKTGESESESGGNKSDGRGRRPGQNGQSTPRAKTTANPKPYAPLAPAKARSGQENSGNMTVETETVSSVPQATLSGGSERSGNARGESGQGSLRLKPSTETIRPKKDRRKASRKQSSLQSGTGGYSRNWFSPSKQQDSDHKASCNPSRPSLLSVNPSRLRPHHRSTATNSGLPQSPLLSPAEAETPNVLSPTLRKLTDFGLHKASSKADIFEAKVASAVDEANSSDSDETFVYESNQPETHTRPRDHSRTPSVASIASQVNHRDTSRSIGDALAGGPRIAGKRSMKFSSAYNDADSPDNRKDSIRSGNLRPAGGSSTHLHHHIGRHGRTAGVHTPGPNAETPLSAARIARSRPSSRPTSATQNQFPHKTKKNGEVPFDIDVEGADDERTPLIGTVRTPRNRAYRQRPGSASLRQIDYYQNRRRSWLARFAGCIVVTIMFALVVVGAVGFLFATTKPLYEVSIKEIQNVLASEQELMLDLLVEAVNPNIISISIADMDVNIFAKSKHIGTDPSSPSSTASTTHQTELADHSSSTDVLASGWPPFWDPDDGNHDHGTDPMPDPSGDSSTMLLGRIFQFDSALSFDGSPLQRHPHYSIGELRLTRPGNKTEAGGSARWEKVLDWPFELIVRGVVKYQLPLTGKPKTVAIGRSVIVHPEEGVDENGGMRTEPRWGLGPGPRIEEVG